jgi:tetratricopeptide (TPR) repeat protein
LDSNSSEPAEKITLLHDIEAAVAASDTDRAVALARDALSEGVEHPLLLNLRAFWHEQQGRPEAALEDLSRARELAPDDALVCNALGLCLARLNRLGDARAAFQDAARLQPDFAPAHYNMGWVSEDLGLPVDAREAFLRAEQLDPQNADPPARLAYLAVVAGDDEAARRHASRAISLDPLHPMAHLAIALCEIDDNHAERAEARLQQILVEDRMKPLARAMTRGLLGDCLDVQNKFAEAFAAYAQCNREFAHLFAPKFRSPQIEPMPAYLFRIAGYFGAVDAGAWKSPGRTLPESAPVDAHVFIVGFPRSGTTLLDEILSAHPQVCNTGEKDGLRAAARRFLGGTEALDQLSRLDWSDLRIFRETYWRDLREQGLQFDGKVLVDSHPGNAVKLPLIAKLFPEAKILFMTRDPRDVIFSCFRSRLRMNPTNYELLTLDGAAQFYDGLMGLTDILRSKLALTTLNVSYETLVRDFRNSVIALHRYVGLNPERIAWDAVERARMRATGVARATQMARGFNSEQVGSWRPYADWISPVTPILEPWIARFGAAAD